MLCQNSILLLIFSVHLNGLVKTRFYIIFSKISFLLSFSDCNKMVKEVVHHFLSRNRHRCVLFVEFKQFFMISLHLGVKYYTSDVWINCVRCLINLNFEISSLNVTDCIFIRDDFKISNTRTIFKNFLFKISFFVLEMDSKLKSTLRPKWHGKLGREHIRHKDTVIQNCWTN